MPFVLFFLPISWMYLVKYFDISGDLQGSKKIIKKEYHELGAMSKAEQKVLAIVILYALGLSSEVSGQVFLALVVL